TRTLVATFDRAETLVTAVSAITSSQLEPAAVEIRTGSSVGADCPGAPKPSGEGGRRTYGLLLKFESTLTALDTYVQRARALMHPADSEVVSSQSEIDLWREHIRAPWQSPGMVFRFAWM